MDTICALAQAIGPDNLAIFVPVIQKLMQRHKTQSDKFTRLAAKLLAHDPPCMSDAQDWESGNAWMDLLAPPPRPETLTSSLPDAPGWFWQIRVDVDFSMLVDQLCWLGHILYA